MRYKTVTITLALVITSCSSSKNIFGTYTSNFPVNGYHFRQIRLKPDSTLEYRYWGHMIYDTATGRFSLTRDKLILTYDPVRVDTSVWAGLRKQGITLMEQEYSRLGKSAPFGLLLRNNKLFIIEENQQIIKTKSNSKGKSKRYFLKKIG